MKKLLLPFLSTPLMLFSFDLMAQNVGIGTTTPENKLTVQTVTGNYGITHTDGTITLGTYVGVGSGWFGTKSNHPLTFFTNNSQQQMTLLTNGNFGIGLGITRPVNKLQIGSMGSTGYNGNDFAIGNGANAFGIAQANNGAFVESSTHIILLPDFRNSLGGSGYVGINNFTPNAPLDVYNYNFSGISIIASGRVLATGFDVSSDARIKEINGYSNSSKDLKILNELKVTDYTLKDKKKNRNKSFKKVIAQEVEKVYPQVVSKHPDFIPNVYQSTNKLEKTVNSYLLSFANKHNISNAAKKIQVILSKGVMQEMDIVSIPSETEVVVSGKDIEGDQLFVYGEQVDDFRTVDYEGLTTLNISATQELSKLIEAQNKKIAELEKRLEALEKK